MYLEKMLHDLSGKKNKLSLYLPGLWLNHKTPGPTKVDYPTFLSSRIEEILSQKNQHNHTSRSDWTRDAVIYNLFVRFFSAYDHNQDGGTRRW